MNANLLYSKIKSIKKRLPGNSLEKMALIYILKAQFYILLSSVLFLIAAIFIHRYSIFFLVFLYPAFTSGTIFIPMVLQEPGQANRYQAISYAPIIYLFSFILTLAVCIITYYINFKICLWVFTALYLYSIYIVFKKIKKRLK